MEEPYKHLKALLRGASDEAITDLAQIAGISEGVYAGNEFSTEINIGAQRLCLTLIKMADSEPLKEIRNVNKRKVNGRS